MSDELRKCNSGHYLDPYDDKVCLVLDQNNRVHRVSLYSDECSCCEIHLDVLEGRATRV